MRCWARFTSVKSKKKFYGKEPFYLTSPLSRIVKQTSTVHEKFIAHVTKKFETKTKHIAHTFWSKHTVFPCKLRLFYRREALKNNQSDYKEKYATKKKWTIEKRIAHLKL